MFVRFVLRTRDEGPRAAFSALVQETREQLSRGRRHVGRVIEGEERETGEGDVFSASSSGMPVDSFGEKVAGVPASPDGFKVEVS